MCSFLSFLFPSPSRPPLSFVPLLPSTLTQSDLVSCRFSSVESSCLTTRGTMSHRILVFRHLAPLKALLSSLKLFWYVLLHCFFYFLFFFRFSFCRVCSHLPPLTIAALLFYKQFAYLGITAVISFKPVFHLSWSFSLIFWTLILCFVSRAANIFLFCSLANLGRKRRIPFKMQCVMWFAGLRGAIAFALALNTPTTHSATIVTTTLSVVIFTTLICGGFTEPLLSLLGLKQSSNTSSPSVCIDHVSFVFILC